MLLRKKFVSGASCKVCQNMMLSKYFQSCVQIRRTEAAYQSQVTRQSDSVNIFLVRDIEN